MISEDIPRKPGRPRSAQAHQAIIDAAIQLFLEEGFNGMSLEGVAARAGVGKTTIYRRWASKEALVVDAMRSINANVPILDTGDLRADLTQMMQSAFREFSTPNLQKLLLRALVEIEDNPALMQAYRDEIGAVRLQQMIMRLQRAQERGEIRADFDIQLVVAIIGGPIVFHMLINALLPGMPGNIVDQLIEGIFTGIGVHQTSDE